MNRRTTLAAAALCAVLAGAARAQSVTTAFTYQGRLTSGGVGQTALYDFQFKLYDASSGGTLLGTVSANNVQATGGLFTTSLDFGNQFTGNRRWLEISVRPAGGGSFTTLTPRQELTANPYTLGLGLPVTDSANVGGAALSITNNNSGGGSAISGTGYHGVEGTSNAGGGGSYGGYFFSSQSSGNGVYGECDNATNAYGVWGVSTQGVGVNGSSSTGIGGLFSGAVGVSGQSFATGSAGIGVQGFGGLGNIGVRGDAGNGGISSYGVFGASTAAGGNGVYGEANTGASAYGVWGSSSSGVGVYGQGPIGVQGFGTGTATYGVLGVGGNAPVGVRGEASNGGGGSYGGYFVSTANIGNGVYGECSIGTAAYGVWGRSTTGLAGNFSGNVSISGSLSKGGGSFKIDHPLDPANKYLYHSFVESPDMMNVYNGIATLDGTGSAVVVMPDWFQTLNSDFRYQLTCIGGFAPVYIAREVENNSFAISGGQPGMRVSWQVTGIRQDRWANAHRIPVEELKRPEERGLFLHPDLYGLTEASSIDTLKMPPPAGPGRAAMEQKAAAARPQAPAVPPVKGE